MERIYPAHQMLLTVSEVARVLGVSKSTIYRRIDDGVLEAIQVGHSMKILRDAAYQAAAGKIASTTSAVSR